jgi:hypothetical protein
LKINPGIRQGPLSVEGITPTPAFPKAKPACGAICLSFQGLAGFPKKGKPLEGRGSEFNFIAILLLFMIYNLIGIRRGVLPKHAGAYKGEKRRKELARLKKQEERRQRRFQKEERTPSDAERVEQEEKESANP